MKSAMPTGRAAEKKTSGDTCNGRDGSDECALAIGARLAGGGAPAGIGGCGSADAAADSDFPVVDARTATAGARPAEQDRHARRHLAAAVRPTDDATGAGRDAYARRDTDQLAHDDDARASDRDGTALEGRRYTPARRLEKAEPGI